MISVGSDSTVQQQTRLSQFLMEGGRYYDAAGQCYNVATWTQAARLELLQRVQEKRGMLLVVERDRDGALVLRENAPERRSLRAPLGAKDPATRSLEVTPDPPMTFEEFKRQVNETFTDREWQFDAEDSGAFKATSAALEIVGHGVFALQCAEFTISDAQTIQQLHRVWHVGMGFLDVAQKLSETLDDENS